MELLVLIPGFFIGLFLFLLLNEIFDIFYFGFKGIASTFLGCWFAGNIIIVLLGYAAKWLILIFAVLWLISKIFKKKKEPEEQQQTAKQQPTRQQTTGQQPSRQQTTGQHSVNRQTGNKK